MLKLDFMKWQDVSQVHLVIHLKLFVIECVNLIMINYGLCMTDLDNQRLPWM